MARTNLEAIRQKPEVSELLTLHVLRRERISPNFSRVTLGGGDIARFTPMGFDQWFRLFIPVAEGSLSRLPNKLDTVSYLRYLSIAKTSRPVLRNYTVRGYREHGPSGPELDVDFVIHGSIAEGTAGPAATWADSCEPGDAVAILDEGIGFAIPEGCERVVLVADETGLPAVAGILESLPRDAMGTAIIEVPSRADAQQIDAPLGIDVRWVVRDGATAKPGVAASVAATELPLDGAPFYAWVVGEQSLPTGLRRHWVAADVPKGHITFCGYWRAGRSH
ncbi:siderophore-interacting protein [Salinibacterium sp. SYSU T00001]|uniref:siderophore-interacting protein n=1 Tax=Homoserinimonas sedimenticola TaxID=2986805 RepID=UPI002235EF07|nr:siderophore-interacting protein [Salinibacterium sedimenticola]MCW4386601.1 siderophore-interacting protein [Salinibacterium sedimenticola]